MNENIYRRLLAVILAIASVLTLADASAQAKKAAKKKGERASGIFYSTLYAKEGEYLRIKDHGLMSSFFFLADVNGDGRDDAVVYDREGPYAGTVRVALSDGTLFGQPAEWVRFSSKLSFTEVLMGDVNGDGRADICFVHTELNRWEVALSTGEGFAFPVHWDFDSPGSGPLAGFTLADIDGDGRADALFARNDGDKVAWYSAVSTGAGFETGTEVARWDAGMEYLFADVDGDGRAESLAVDPATGNWYVKKGGAGDALLFASGFGMPGDRFFAYDIDRDGRADAVVWRNGGSWTVAYGDGNGFGEPKPWIFGHKPAQSKNNVPEPYCGLVGSVNGRDAAAAVMGFGAWWVLENPGSGQPLHSAEYDTYESWGNDYTPWLGRYDSGDPAVHDKQLEMIHDAGFTYIMLDITNGNNPWVDDRAKTLCESIIRWNNNLKPGDRKLYFAVSMGTSRQKEGDDAAEHIEFESKRTWEEFYLPYKEAAFIKNGKPLLVHFVEFPRYRENFERYRKENPRGTPYSDRFEIGWMFNLVENTPEYAGSYGWDVGDPAGNPYGDMMPLMPGFYNGLFDPVDREGGEYYRRQWLRVFEHGPSEIWINSFNENWEHTSVEPSYLHTDSFVAYGDLARPWTDLHGNRMDDFYWVMTRRYNRLLMFGELPAGAYIQENGSKEIYEVTSGGFRPYGGIPQYAPVLLVPEGFRNSFKGRITE